MEEEEEEEEDLPLKQYSSTILLTLASSLFVGPVVASNSGTGSSLNPDQFRLPDHRSPGSGFMQNHGDTGRSLRTSVSLNYSFDSVGYATLIDIDIDIGTMISPFSGNFICDNSFG